MIQPNRMTQNEIIPMHVELLTTSQTLLVMTHLVVWLKTIQDLILLDETQVSMTYQLRFFSPATNWTENKHYLSLPRQVLLGGLNPSEKNWVRQSGWVETQSMQKKKMNVPNHQADLITTDHHPLGASISSNFFNCSKRSVIPFRSGRPSCWASLVPRGPGSIILLSQPGLRKDMSQPGLRKDMEVSIVMGVPQARWMVYFRENPI